MSAAHPPVTLVEPPEVNLVTTRKGNYRDKVGGQGYTGANDQVHHVLPCGSSTKSKTEFVDKQSDPGIAKQLLEQTTHYDVNQKPNLIGLPTRVVYAAKFGTPFNSNLPTPPPIDPLVVCNLPIHLWKHIDYSKAAKKLLDDVWGKAALKIQKHENGDPKLSATDIKDEIQRISDKLRGLITAPTRKRTKEAWNDGRREAFDIWPL